MLTSIKTIVAAIALTAFVAGPASAMISQSDVTRDIQSALSGGSNVFASVNDGTVTLTGYYADAGDQLRALQAAKNTVGVDRVINLATQSN